MDAHPLRVLLIVLIAVKSSESIQEKPRTKRAIVTAGIALGCSTFVAIKGCSNVLDKCPPICDVLETICSVSGKLSELTEICKPGNIAAIESLIQGDVFSIVGTSEEDARRALESLGNDTKNFFFNLVDAVKKKGEEAVNEAKKTGEAAVNTIKKSSEEAAGRVRKTGEEALNQLNKTIEEAIGKLKKAGEDAVDKLNKEIDEAVDKVKQTGEEAVDSAKKAGEQVVSTLKNTGEETVAEMKKRIKEVFDTVKKPFENAADTVKNTGKEAIDTIQKTGEEALDELKSAFSSSAPAQFTKTLVILLPIIIALGIAY
ncbi:uncharacterized protein LOC121384195 [Gigantopelta aegis]|uniref:uncharacterized protein LOC121384195 n=1 Tax=Gigantopelta aegis TaxID=1735272 RepID=UPI001B88B163|nr:uncharacterized protein LOC121384195 [Gigantopelta aegis]